MKPDRSNYEIWLIDWLDGILGKAQVDQLMSFIKENPDLKEEADFLSFSHLSSSKDQPSRINIKEKTPSEIPHSQIEYLSVAYLEKDMSPDQIAELQENLAENQGNKDLFESIQKIKLAPQQHHYKNKKDLWKLTPGEKIIRLSIIGLSTAATIAAIILSSVFIPDYLSGKRSADAKLIMADTGNIEPFVLRSKIIRSVPEEINIQYVKNESPRFVLSKDKTSGIIYQPVAMAIPDTASPSNINYGIGIVMAAVTLKPGMNFDPLHQNLIAYNNDFTASSPEDERNRLSKFIARTFREKLLKDKNSGDEPIKAYELAEAGVEGLNKLLGWEMTLVATNDAAGDLKSVYFSSRILKFNAPVKKDDAAQ